MFFCRSKNKYQILLKTLFLQTLYLHLMICVNISIVCKPAQIVLEVDSIVLPSRKYQVTRTVVTCLGLGLAAAPRGGRQLLKRKTLPCWFPWQHRHVSMSPH